MPTWEEILNAPEYLNQVRVAEAAAKRRGLALPNMDPAVRGVAGDVANRLLRLQDVGGRADLASRALDVRRGEVDLARQKLGLEQAQQSRYESRLMPATLLSLGNVALGGLGAYANITRAERSEAMNERLLEQGRLSGLAQAQALRSKQRYDAMIADLLSQYTAKHPVPESL